MIINNTSTASHYFPPSFMHKGLEVTIRRDYRQKDLKFSVIVTDFDHESASGIYTSPEFPEISNKKFRFRYHEIISVKGSLEWNIDHMYVFCSEKILEGEPVGYFYAGPSDLPLHYCRTFFAESEIYENKFDVKGCEVLIKTLIQLDNSVLPHLNEYCNYGWIKNAKGGFDKLTAEYIKPKDHLIFPCSYDHDWDCSLLPFWESCRMRRLDKFGLLEVFK